MGKSVCDNCNGLRITVPTSHIRMYQGQRFMVTESPAPCEYCSSVAVKAVRTDKNTEVQTVQECILETKKRTRNEVWIYVKRGYVTGYEAIHATKLNVKAICSEGWLACTGTKGLLDRLFIPSTEMNMACKKMLLK